MDANIVKPKIFQKKGGRQTAVTDWFRTGQPTFKMNLQPMGPHGTQGAPMGPSQLLSDWAYPAFLSDCTLNLFVGWSPLTFFSDWVH